MEWLSNLADTASQLAAAGSNAYKSVSDSDTAGAKATKTATPVKTTTTSYLPWIIGGAAALLVGGLVLVLMLRK